MISKNYQLSVLSDQILKAYYKVYNTLGFGFAEKVYERSLLVELKKLGLRAEAQVPIKVYYEGIEVVDFYADIVVNQLIVLELKAADVIKEEFEAQLVNYLRATEIEVGLILNFGKTPQVKRRVLTNDRKTNLNKS